MKLGLLASRRDGAQDAIDADLDRDRYQELGLCVNDVVYISPRRARVFMQDHGMVAHR